MTAYVWARTLWNSHAPLNGCQACPSRHILMEGGGYISWDSISVGVVNDSLASLRWGSAPKRETAEHNIYRATSSKRNAQHLCCARSHWSAHKCMQTLIGERWQIRRSMCKKLDAHAHAKVSDFKGTRGSAQSLEQNIVRHSITFNYKAALMRLRERMCHNRCRACVCSQCAGRCFYGDEWSGRFLINFLIKEIL